MPELERLRPRLAANGIDLMGLNVDTEPGANIRGFVSRSVARYRVFIGGIGAVEQLYATDELSVPLSIIIDDKGVVVDLIPGWSRETKRRFESLTRSER